MVISGQKNRGAEGKQQRRNRANEKPEKINSIISANEITGKVVQSFEKHLNEIPGRLFLQAERITY